ncbi:hypothetical protein E1258_10250 [Micromonospora sp. KC207]|nr:hypothetical protein E1258_10250 [Micromonospora sp. KC207]
MRTTAQLRIAASRQWDESEDIVDLCGRSGTTVTELVYRHQLRPVLLQGAAVMDRIFAVAPDR